MQALKGINILLRAMEPEDIDTLYNWENDTNVWHISNTVAPFSRYVVEQYVFSMQDIYTAKQLRLMIEADKKPIGCIDIFDFDPTNKKAGIGILIADEMQNKGYASDALQTLIKYCFNALQLHQLYCSILTDNEASLKLFTKHGFTVCGTRKDWLIVNNVWKDEHFLQLLNE
ncbi:MAG: GNAT family N-acetyltransferase [Bacteroidetes bacterium]|nr:GNAT family N-acetyltransferase [Bacteroidota bacterium]